VTLRALLPWEFSPTVLAATVTVLAAYLRGWWRVGRVAGLARPAAFIAAVALPYAFLETHLEYLSLHLFWLQRIHHLVLHHLAPFLLALSAPGPILAQGTPQWILTSVLQPLAANRACRAVYRGLQQPVVASILFVGLIFFWLTPTMQLYSMLSRTVYGLMNASMLIDGILFWWLMVGPEDPARIARVSYGGRMAVLVAITVPQSLLGAYLTFHASVLYPSFSICGRATSLAPLVDQQLAGLNTWIPPGMMSAAGLAVIASRWLADEAAGGVTSRAARESGHPPRFPRAASRRAAAGPWTGSGTPPPAPAAAGSDSR
jgi:putative membrane protein